MSVFNQVLALGLVAVVLVAAPARGASEGLQSAESAVVSADDSALRSRIVTNLKKSTTMTACDINVFVREGVVTLEGTVRSADEKAQAARLATIEGATAVRNEIVVESAAVKSGTDRVIDATKRAGEKGVDMAKDAAQMTGEKAKELSGAVATKTMAAVATAGEAISDGWITTKLKAKFFDETLLKGSDTHVETNDRVVTLTGTVASDAALARAEAVAVGTEGVTRVVNRLVAAKEQ